jgi:hypothetical protein
MKKQAEAANLIKQLFSQRGLDIPSRKMALPDSQQWTVFELNER